MICTAEAEWITLPHILVEDAGYKGYTVEGIYVYWFFVLKIKFRASLSCKGCDPPAQKNIEFIVTLPISYREAGMLVMPARLKRWIMLYKAVRSGGKLVKILAENAEIMAYVKHFIEPMLILVQNSAGPVCMAKVKPENLRDQVQKYIDDHTQRIGPWSYEPQIA